MAASQSDPSKAPESFCFAITSFRPDYTVEERHIGPLPDSLWLPPTSKEGFTKVAETGWHSWDNGTVSKVPFARVGQIIPYSATSMVWSDGRQAFLHVPCDCTEVAVKNAKKKNMPVDWSKITFHHERVHNRCLSLIGYHYERNELGARGSPFWMPELLPEVYQYHGQTEYQGNCQLAGDLATLLSLAAFSIEPHPQMQVIGQLLRKTNQGTEWRHHGHNGSGSKMRTYRRDFKGKATDILQGSTSGEL